VNQFEDLKIVSYDPAKVRASRHGGGLRQMPLLLSGSPPAGWAPLLESEYANSLSGNKRSISVEGLYIYVDCVPEELAAILEDLKPMVSKTNEEYKAEQVRLAARQKIRDAEAAAVKQRLEHVKGKLKFD
jgi:hypothetical protein